MPLALRRIDAPPAVADSPVRQPALPISKLRGASVLRNVLKGAGITNCDQLLTAAARPAARARLADALRVDHESMLILVQRADMARVNGIGAVFGMMLEELGIYDVAALAAASPEELHERLRAYNLSERIARRSPTPEEVADWVGQARALPIVLG